jgi:hypothetical protein
MDLGGYWQENKRFALMVGAGVVVFVIGFALESSMYQGQVNAALAGITGYKNKLKDALFSSQDLAAVEAENAALRDSTAKLSAAVAFHARPEFVPDPAAGPSTNHYLRTFSRVHEELLQRASRAGLTLDGSLGMPELQPTNESEIVRYLEALDLVESVADLAIRAHAARIDKVQVRLDPARSSREGVGAIERTRVQMQLSGSSLAMTRVLEWSQRPPSGGRVFALDQVDMNPARGKNSEVRLDVTFVIARVKPLEELK